MKFRSRRPVDLVGTAPETSALLAARRWTLLVFAIVGILAQVYTAYEARSIITDVEKLFTAGAVIMILVGGIASRTQVGLWILVASAWLLVATNMLPGSRGPWLLVNSTALFGALAIGMLAPRMFVAISAVVLPIFLHVAWSTNPQGVVATGYAAWGGWIPPIQVGATLIATYLVWTRSMRNARMTDAKWNEDRQVFEKILTEKVRQESFRRHAVRVHESLLNTIKCLVDSSSTHRAIELATLKYTPSLGDRDGSTLVSVNVHEWLRAATQPFAQMITFRLASDSNRSISHDSAEALTAALIEIFRNVETYEQNPHVNISVFVVDNHLVLNIVGAQFPITPEKLSIGVRKAILGGIASVDGHVIPTSNGMKITIPLHGDTHKGTQNSSSVFGRSRALVAAALTGMTVAGVLYFVSLIGANGNILPTIAMIAATSFIGISLVVRSYQEKRVKVVYALPAIAAAISVPWWAMLAFSDGCGSMQQTLASAVNVSGLMLVAVSLWTWPWIMFIGLGAWGASVVVLANALPQVCGSSLFVAAANAMFILPIVFIGVTYAGVLYQRSSHMIEVQRTEEVKARAAIAADAEISLSLARIEGEVLEVFGNVASAGHISIENQVKLQILDAQIRMMLQTDPTSTGSFPQLASRIIAMACSAGRPIRVRGLDSSADSRPLSPDIEKLLMVIALGDHATLSTFCDQVSDNLVLTGTILKSEIPSPGLHGSAEFDDLEVTIDPAGFEDEQAIQVAVRVSRQISIASKAYSI